MARIPKPLFFLLLICSCHPAWSESKRIEVYQVSQQYWDVSPGDTLSGIAAKLLPNNPGMQLRLMDDIVRLNPESFIENNKDLIIANTRLWLPGSMTRPDTTVDKKDFEVKNFSWGNIKTRKTHSQDNSPEARGKAATSRAIPTGVSIELYNNQNTP